MLVTNEIYHVFNRGVEKRNIFLGKREYEHFIDTLKHYRQIPKKKLSRRGKTLSGQRESDRSVEILGYCLMPNHFHLLLKQVSDGGISHFMRKSANSYTRYFNIKNDRVGPLFQGSFKAVRVETDEQLLHVSRYIHLNPLVSGLVRGLKNYKWTSYPVYIGEKDSDLVANKEILSHFSSNKDYEEFVLDQVEYARSLDKLKHHLL